MGRPPKENSFNIVCGKCGKQGTVNSLTKRVKCVCGEVFMPEEIPQVQYPKMEIVEHLATEPKKLEADVTPKQEEKIYGCGNCKSQIKLGDKACAGCGFRLEWS